MHLNRGDLCGMLCIAIEDLLLSNLCRKVKLNTQKSVRVVVSKKLVKADGEKDSTVAVG